MESWHMESIRSHDRECHLGDPPYNKKMWDSLNSWTLMRTEQIFQGKHVHVGSYQWIARANNDAKKNITFHKHDRLCLTKHYVPRMESLPPTTFPSLIPTPVPSSLPSLNPSFCPSIHPTTKPSTQPSQNPTFPPTINP